MLARLFRAPQLVHGERQRRFPLLVDANLLELKGCSILFVDNEVVNRPTAGINWGCLTDHRVRS